MSCVQSAQMGSNMVQTSSNLVQTSTRGTFSIYCSTFILQRLKLVSTPVLKNYKTCKVVLINTSLLTFSFTLTTNFLPHTKATVHYCENTRINQRVNMHPYIVFHLFLWARNERDVWCSLVVTCTLQHKCSKRVFREVKGCKWCVRQHNKARGVDI